jgi:hypothetical protein
MRSGVVGGIEKGRDVASFIFFGRKTEGEGREEGLRKRMWI